MIPNYTKGILLYVDYDFNDYFNDNETVMNFSLYNITNNDILYNFTSSTGIAKFWANDTFLSSSAVFNITANDLEYQTLSNQFNITFLNGSIIINVSSPIQDTDYFDDVIINQ